MSGRITKELTDEDQRTEALAFLDQARQFYATAGSYQSANPLLYYYAFLNLAKPLIRLRGYKGSLDKTTHGLYNERIGKGVAPADFQLVIEGPHAKKVNVFAELSKRLGSGIPTSGPTQIEDLMPQVVVGHRLWRQAASARERFFGLEKVEMRQNPDTSEMWLRLVVRREDFGRFGRTHKEIRERCNLDADFQEVRGEDIPTDCVAFQQRDTVNYGQYPNDHLDDLVDGLRDRLWRIVSADPEQGYRRYYLHLADDPKSCLPQLSSIWALLYHYGSLVRYQPHIYAAMTRGKYGAFIQEFVSAQPEQMLYLFASEICQREVAKPAIA